LTIKAKIGNAIYLSTGSVPINAVQEIKNSLTMQNPDWLKNEKYGRWNGNTPRELRYYQHEDGVLTIPRGFLPQMEEILKGHGYLAIVMDDTRTVDEVNFTFSGTLRPYQKEAAESILSKDMGVAQMPTGSGKTVVALYCIAQRKQPAIVIVDTKELFDQWIDRIESLLGIPKKEVGIITGGKKNVVGEKITVSTVQSLYKCADQILPHIGHVVLDECHIVPAKTFSEAVNAFDAKYRLGLSATPYNHDGLSDLIFWYMGELVHSVSPEKLQDLGEIMQVKVLARATTFDYPYHGSDDYQPMIRALINDSSRNSLIAEDVKEFVDDCKGAVLVVSDRIEHCQDLYNRLDGNGFRTEILTSDVKPKSKREAIVQDLNAGNVRVLIATTQLIGKGFDCKSLTGLFITMPISSPRRLVQLMGRVVRTEEGKEQPIVYDYDDKPEVLKYRFHQRGDIYESEGAIIGRKW